EVIAGFDPRDSTSIDEASPRFAAALGGDLRGLTIGRPRELELPGVDPEVASEVDRALATLVDLGASVREVSLPHVQHSLARYDGVRYGARAAAPGQSLLEMYCRTRGAGFGPEVKRRIMLGTFALRSGYYDAYYLKAQKVRALIARDYQRALAEVDLIASP